MKHLLTDMPARGQRIKDYRFSATDRLFFDANIWLLIVGTFTPPLDHRVKTYSNALKRARDAGARIEIDAIVMGEFINRCLRDEYNLLYGIGEVRSDFKSYRASATYAASVRAVSAAAQQILTYCHPVEEAFAHCDLTALLTQFGAGQSDWSDELIIALCQARDLTLVTDDSDFLDSGLRILTRNPTYFARRGD